APSSHHSFPPRRPSDLLFGLTQGKPGGEGAGHFELAGEIAHRVQGAPVRPRVDVPRTLAGKVEGAVLDGTDPDLQPHRAPRLGLDRKSTRLNSSHVKIS